MRKVTTRSLRQMKQNREKIAMITAYDYPGARMAEKAGADLLLVGDSVGMTVLGYDSTIPVTLEDILHHTKAVTRGRERAMVIADMPFATAHLSPSEVIRAAARLLQEGSAYAVKIEGGKEVLTNISACITAGIPVMGHIGLTPQSINQLGGYIYQGKDQQTAQKLIDDAKQLEAAGIFALVLECVPEELSKAIAEQLEIPVIGIGAGRYVDGQVLVQHDLLGLGGDWHPSFVKVYGNFGQQMTEAIQQYVEEVKSGKFPEEAHVRHISEEMIGNIYGGKEE